MKAALPYLQRHSSSNSSQEQLSALHRMLSTSGSITNTLSLQASGKHAVTASAAAATNPGKGPQPVLLALNDMREDGVHLDEM